MALVNFMGNGRSGSITYGVMVVVLAALKKTHSGTSNVTSKSVARHQAHDYDRLVAW